MRKFFFGMVAGLLLIACDGSTIHKPGPDTGTSDADQAATGDELTGDDGSLVNDDGQLVNDDGELVNDDGELINDDGEPVGDDGEISDDGQVSPDDMSDGAKPDEDLPVGACGDNGDCEGTEFCAKPDGTCDSYLAGTCDRRPTEEECMMYSAIIEVCGCDNKTYQHPCFANAAGVNIAYKGKCGEVVTCETNEECGDFVAMLCQKDTGVCDNGIGVCIMPETGCSEIYAPVCGCDGITYSNECLAHASFVNVAYEGECGGGGEYSTLYYYYEQSSMAQPEAKVVIVTGDGTVPFEGAELVTREAVNQYVYLRTTFYGPEGGGVVNLQLRLNAGSSIPVTTTLDGTNSYAQWTNFYSGGTEVLIGNLYGDITISQYNRNNNTITLIEMSGEQLTFVPN